MLDDAHVALPSRDSRVIDLVTMGATPPAAEIGDLGEPVGSRMCPPQERAATREGRRAKLVAILSGTSPPQSIMRDRCVRESQSDASIAVAAVTN